MGWVLLGAALGVLWVFVAWAEEDGRGPDWTDQPIVMVALLLVLGMVLQRWASPGEAATVSAAFLAGVVLLPSMADSREEGLGHAPAVVLWALAILVLAVGCTLLGHWLASRLLARRASPAP